MAEKGASSELPEMKIAESAYSVDLDEVAHHEPPHLDLYCLPSSILILNIAWIVHFLKICRQKFCLLPCGS